MENKKASGGKREGAGRPSSPETKVITFRVKLDHEQSVRDAVKKVVSKLDKIAKK